MISNDSKENERWVLKLNDYEGQLLPSTNKNILHWKLNIIPENWALGVILKCRNIANLDVYKYLKQKRYIAC